MMLAMAVQKYLVAVVEKTNLAGRFWRLRLEKPQGFGYLAGQYVSIKVSEDGQRRSYSLASAPGDGYLELIFDVKPGGLGSNFLKDLAVGAEVEILGPMGRFVVEGELGERKFLFAGTGSGIVPLWSMIRDLLERCGFKGEVRLHWGMREDGEIFLAEELQRLKATFPNFGYDVVMSRASERWMNCRGHVQDCLAGHNQDWREWEVYLCGSQAMVLDVAALLREKGVEKERIYFEKFY